MSELNRATMCSRLRCKNLYAYVDPAHREHSTSDLTQQYWCNLTMTNLGPDEKLCDSEACCKGRWCYTNALEG